MACDDSDVSPRRALLPEPSVLGRWMLPAPLMGNISGPAAIKARGECPRQPQGAKEQKSLHLKSLGICITVTPHKSCLQLFLCILWGKKKNLWLRSRLSWLDGRTSPRDVEGGHGHVQRGTLLPSPVSCAPTCCRFFSDSGSGEGREPADGLAGGGGWSREAGRAWGRTGHTELLGPVPEARPRPGEPEFQESVPRDRCPFGAPRTDCGHRPGLDTTFPGQLPLHVIMDLTQMLPVAEAWCVVQSDHRRRAGPRRR